MMGVRRIEEKTYHRYPRHKFLRFSQIKADFFATEKHRGQRERQKELIADFGDFRGLLK